MLHCSSSCENEKKKEKKEMLNCPQKVMNLDLRPLILVFYCLHR